MSNAATGADSSAPAREPTLAEVQAVLGVMRLSGQLPANAAAGWELLMQFLPLFESECRASAEYFDAHAPSDLPRQPVMSAWDMSARNVIAGIRVSVQRITGQPAVFDAVSAVLPDIANALRG